MSQYKKLLRSIHNVQRQHPSNSEYYDLFNDVWATYIEDSPKGMFCEHIRTNGYPLSRDLATKSGYISRPKIERNFIEHVDSGDNIVLVGCEGSGKSTFCHYSLGKLYFEERTYDHRSFLYVDASAYPDVSREQLADRLFDSVFFGLKIDLARRNLQEHFEKEIHELSKLSAANKIVYNLDTARKYCMLCFATLACEESDIIYYVVLDNMDSLSSKVVETIFSEIKTLVDSSKKSAADILESYGSPRPSSIEIPIRFIIPTRTPTYSHIISASLGLFPIERRKEIFVEDDLKDNISVWKIVSDYLFVQNSDKLKIALKRHNITIPIPKTSATYQPDDLFGFYQDLVDWLQSKQPQSDKVIKMFCGRSIRRYKMYGLKVIGHIAIARSFVFIKHGIFSEHSDVISRYVMDAVFDFFQPIGIMSNSNIYSQFHLNPFRVISDDSIRERNPLLGVVAVSYMNNHFKEICSSELFAYRVDGSAIYQHLTKMRYDDAAISEAFLRFWTSGLLRPFRNSKHIVEELGTFPPVYEYYIIDKVALEIYFDLINATNIDRSISFMNAAERYAYGLDYTQYFYDIIYSCFVNLCFIREASLAETKLISKLDQFQAEPPQRSYTASFTRRLIRHWGGVIKEQRDHKRDSQLEEMYTTCQNLLAEVQEISSNLSGS